MEVREREEKGRGIMMDWEEGIMWTGILRCPVIHAWPVGQGKRITLPFLMTLPRCLDWPVNVHGAKYVWQDTLLFLLLAYHIYSYLFQIYFRIVQINFLCLCLLFKIYSGSCWFITDLFRFMMLNYFIIIQIDVVHLFRVYSDWFMCWRKIKLTERSMGKLVKRDINW